MLLAPSMRGKYKNEFVHIRTIFHYNVASSFDTIVKKRLQILHCSAYPVYFREFKAYEMYFRDLYVNIIGITIHFDKSF